MTDAAPQSATRKGLTLGLLTLLYVLYLLDRNAIVVTQELIKAEFRLSDTQMGFVIGTVYGVSYAIAGLPMGWLVDRVNRRNLLVGILSVWSALTALCGASTAYWHLVAMRIGVAASECGGSPASLSILSDLYPPERRSTVASIFYAGSGLGLLASFFLGGIIAQEFGWRAVFLAFGLPGLVLAVLMLLIVREPQRGHVEAAPTPESLARATVSLLFQPVLRTVYLGAVLYCLATAAVLGWIVAFLMREHGLDVASAGAIVAGTAGVCAVIGSIVTGHLADRAERRRRGGSLYVVAAAALVNLVAGWIALGASDLPVVIVSLAIFGATVLSYPGPTNAAISELAPGRSRGVAFALYALLSNLLGGGLGPIAVGAISDSALVDAELGLAMRIMLLFNLAAVSAYLVAGRALGRAR